MKVIYQKEGQQMSVELDKSLVQGLSSVMDQLGIGPGEVLLVARTEAGVALSVNKNPDEDVVNAALKQAAFNEAMDNYDGALRELAQ